MPQQHALLPYSPDRLLDFLRKHFNLDNDRGLARKLGMSPQILVGIRAGRITLAASLLLCMAEASGCSVDDLRMLLGDRRSRVRLAYRSASA
jgi:hypothetical protein